MLWLLETSKVDAQHTDPQTQLLPSTYLEVLELVKLFSTYLKQWAHFIHDEFNA